MATLREQFTQKLSRSVRGFEPLEYIIELPKPSVFERDHNQMWLRAYPVETPSPIAEADLNEVLFIDGLFHCRGGNRPQSLEVPQPQLQLQPTICVKNSATEGKRTDALRTLRLSSFNSVVDDGYGRTSPSHLNALRALASAEHVNDVGKFPRLKTVFSAPSRPSFSSRACSFIRKW